QDLRFVLTCSTCKITCSEEPDTMTGSDASGASCALDAARLADFAGFESHHAGPRIKFGGTGESTVDHRRDARNGEGRFCHVRRKHHATLAFCTCHSSRLLFNTEI